MNGRFFGTNGAHADETRRIAVRNAETGEKKVAHRRAIRNFIKGGARVKGRSLFALLDRIIALTRRKSNPLSINRHFFATNKRALTRSDKIIRPTPAQLPFPAAIAPFRAAAALKRKDTGNLLAQLDSSGNIVVQYKYDAWGNHTVTDANGDAITDADHIGNLNPFRYRGYYFDRETGFYFLQSRYYDPEVGRFLNMDSIEYADPESVNGINLYSYCINDPVNYIDPFGTFVISGSLMFLGGLALLVLGVAGLTAISQTSTANPDFSLDIGIDALPGSVVESDVASSNDEFLDETDVIEASFDSSVITITTMPAIRIYQANYLKERNPDPYARPGQKKQGRELKNKARRSSDWKDRNGKRGGRKPPKKHTPGRDHRHFFLSFIKPFILRTLLKYYVD